jgi:ankyrin repeat protein
MGTLIKFPYIKLGEKVLKARPSNSFLDNLNNLNYGNHPSLKAQITYLTLLSQIDGNSSFEGLQSKEHLHEGINKMFGIMYSNTPITSSPRDQKDRSLFYKKLATGYQFLGEIIQEELQKGSLDKQNLYSCLDTVGDGGHACAGRWQQVLEQMSFVFRDQINEKLGVQPEPSDKLDQELQNLLYESKMITVNKLSEEFVDKHLSQISTGNKLHYTSFFKRFANENLHLNLSINMENDSFLESELTFLKNEAFNFLKEKNLFNKLLENLRPQFQDKIFKDANFYDSFVEFAKGLFNKNSKTNSDEDVVDYLSTKIFEGFTKNVKKTSLIRTLLLKGYLEKFETTLDISEVVKNSFKNNDYEKLESILRKLPVHLWENEDVKNIFTLKNDIGHTLLISSLQHSIPSLTNFLLEKGADPNEKSENGTPPILYAVMHKNLEFTNILIQKGADLNAKNFYDNTALIFAANHSNFELANLLLQNKADVDTVNFEGNSPLIYATFQKNKEMVKLLVENHANINLQNKKGESALLLASNQGNTEMVKLLLEHGANMDLKDLKGYSPLSVAATLNHYEVVNLLEEKQKTLIEQKQESSSSNENKKKRSSEYSYIRILPSKKINHIGNRDLN